MKRILTAFVLALYLASAVPAQDSKLDKARQNGMNLPVQINSSIKPNVTAQAVLIPRVDARRIFGAEIANNYAVIEVNVGNKSGDAALIIHGIFIDYKYWALSGSSGRSTAAADLDDPARAVAEPFQASTIPSQVASEEYRVVRGQLLDAQMWSKRNWTMRVLTFAGNLAGAYAFSINEEGIVKGLNAFSGVFVPGIREVWPDGTIEQLNRVSDFGYQANKVIPRQGAEVIVCFFPIDRFLTPGFKKLFLKSPALFFAPLQMLVDKKLKNEADGIIKGLDSSLSVEDLHKALPCYLRATRGSLITPAGDDNSFAALMDRNAAATCREEFGIDLVDDKNKKSGKVLQVKDDAAGQGKFKKLLVLDFISQMSLNNVSVTVDGVMTLDTTAIAAKIEAVAFDKVADCDGEKSPCFWSPEAGGGVRTGTISGSYLTGGSLDIAEAGGLKIEDMKVIYEGSSDQQLRFSFKLTQGVPAGNLTFKVNKSKPVTNAPLESQPFVVPVGYDPPHPAVTKVEKEDDTTLTVTGEQFYNTPTYPLVFTLHPPSGDDVEVKSSSVTVKSEKELEVKIPSEANTVGCWTLSIKVADVLGTAKNNSFSVSPTVNKATRIGDQIVVEGAGLSDSDCGKKLPSFKLVHGDTAFDLTPENPPTATKATFTLAGDAKAADSTWKVQVQFDGKDVKNSPLQLTIPKQ